ncbi:MAG TPA: methyltransferase [Candidatus Sulfotelmatobacter sp.]|nr:methyltransferase [Candidatus Sulfotelmatobacter sp.]
MQVQKGLAQGEVNPVQTVLDLAGAYALPRCLHVVADLGVADVLDETPRTAAELAGAIGADPDALGRVLRLLAAHEIFAVRGKAFTHTPASRLLRTDHPHSMRAFVRMFGLRAFWDTQAALLHSVRTGRVAAQEVLPDGFYGYLAADPEASAIFNAAMTAKAHGQVAAVLAAYDFSVFGNIADIGGGRGHLLRAILEAVPTARGVLFDLPRVIDEARPLVSTPRLRLQSGDFFKDALPTCDGYIVMEVIHAFGDADAVTILRAIRQAAQPKTRLLVIEQMIPDNSGPHWAKTLDIHMLALLGGRQRSRQEYAALLNHAGFAFQRQIDTRAGVAILESAAV